MKKHCVQYPDDKFLAVRPCLVAICFGNRPAAKLLGTLLYRYNLRVETKDDAENQNALKTARGETPDQDTTYRIFRKQSQLVDDMCGEMTEKTLHDVAVPMLQLLGFIDLEEHMQSNCYIVNIDLVQQALNLYCPTASKQPQLETFLISVMQLEKFLITPTELENFLIDKKVFLSGLEKVLIRNRNISHYKRGRELKPEVVSSRVLRRGQNLKESSKKNSKKEYVSAHADGAGVFSEQKLSSQSPIAIPTREPTLLQATQEAEFSTLDVEKPPKPAHPTGPPVPPPPEATWCAETAVQVIEAIKGRRYGEVTRKQELAQAAKALRFKIDGTPITRAQFVTAWREMEGWSVWGEKHITPLIRHLVKDDKIVTLLQRTRRAPPSEDSPKVRPLVLVSEAQSKINKERMHARAEAVRATQARKAGGG